MRNRTPKTDIRKTPGYCETKNYIKNAIKEKAKKDLTLICEHMENSFREEKQDKNIAITKQIKDDILEEMERW